MSNVQKYAKVKSPLGAIIRDFFNEPVVNEWVGSDQQVSIPSANITSDDSAYHVRIAAPGMKKEHFDISIEKDHLVISGDSSDSKEEASEKYLRREYNYSSFKRSFALSDDVDREGITAKYEDGILKVVLKKLSNDVLNNVKRIEIR